jgi:hypothetical protein
VPDPIDRLAVVVCRDCCCGSPGKHPDVPHDAHLAALRDAVAGVRGAVVAVSRCLETCERSNVVVVQHRTRRGLEATWLGGLVHQRQLDGLCAWLRAGGPRTSPLPPALRPARFRSPHRVPDRTGGRNP